MKDNSQQFTYIVSIKVLFQIENMANLGTLLIQRGNWRGFGFMSQDQPLVLYKREKDYKHKDIKINSKLRQVVLAVPSSAEVGSRYIFAWIPCEN